MHAAGHCGGGILDRPGLEGGHARNLFQLALLPGLDVARPHARLHRQLRRLQHAGSSRRDSIHGRELVQRCVSWGRSSGRQIARTFEWRQMPGEACRAGEAWSSRKATIAGCISLVVEASTAAAPDTLYLA